MTEFIEKFENKIKNRIFEIGFEDELFESYLADKFENKHWLIQKFFEYNRREGNIKSYILLFIKYLGKNDDFHDEDVIEYLKYYIDQYLTKTTGDFDFFTTSIRTLYNINTNDIDYFKWLFDKIVDKFGANSYILSIFIKIFGELKLSDYFFKCAILMFKSERRSFYEFDIREYLFDLNKIEFKKYFIELLKLFTDIKQKDSLIHFGKYTGLINFTEKKGKYLEYELDNKRIIDDLLGKIKNISFSKSEIKTIEDFIFSEINFIASRYQDIEKNYFDINLFSILKEKNGDLLYECIKQSNLSTFSFSNPDFIYNNLDKNNIGRCIELYDEHINYFFRIFQLIRYYKRDDLISILKKNKKSYNSLIVIENQSKKEQKKWENEEKNRRDEQKKGILKLTKIIDDKTFSPRLLQYYYNSIGHAEDFNVFTVTERKKLDKYTQKHATICLNSAQIEGYNDEKIKNIVVYEETGEQTHSIGRYVHYLYRILNISEYLNFDISNFYRSFVLIYPLIFGDEAQNRLLAFYEGKIKKSDIDYILRAYSEDLHENAIGLRFYNPNGLCRFYERFKKNFLPKQKEKLKDILLDFINSEKIRYKDEFIEKYAEIVSKSEFIKIYKQPTINYFKSILSSEIPIPEDKKIDLDKQLKINELLITKFHDKNAMLWRIEQIENGVVKFKNPNTLQPGQFIGVVHAVSALEDELEFWHDNERSFSHFVEIKSPVNIKQDMLRLFELGLKLQQDIKNRDIDPDYKSYSAYLIRTFYGYINNLDDKKRYYYKVIKLIDKYPNNDLSISILNKHFGIDNKLGQKNKYYHLKNGNKTLKAENIELKEENEKFKRIWGITNPKCIIFVEGLSDKTILETAYEKIYGYNNEFIIRSAGGARALQELLKSLICDSVDWKGVKIIGLFDSDKEGILAFNNIQKKDFLDKQLNFGYNGKIAKNSKSNIYGITLPIPELYNNTFYNKDPNLCFITIESMFDSGCFLKWENDYNIMNGFRTVNFKSTDMCVIDISDNKRSFAKFIGCLDKNYFKNFEPLLIEIKNIINGKYD